MGALKYTNLLFLFALLLVSESFADNKHPLEGSLLVGDDRFIRTFDIKGNLLGIIATKGGGSIDYDCSTGDIFWTRNSQSHEVYAIKVGETKPRISIYKVQTWRPQSIAVDYVTHKVYVADALTGTVSLYDMARGKSSVIINSNLTNVLSIHVDIGEGYLFVQDELQIIRTDLEGQNRQVIYSNELISSQIKKVFLGPSTSIWHSDVVKRLTISQITVDTKIKRLYFVDGINSEVVSVNYKGKDKKVHFQLKSDYLNYASLSLTVLDGYLYWLDGSKNMFKIDLKRGTYTAVSLSTSPLFIKAVSCSKPQIPNPCGVNNGQCQDLCIYSKKNRNNVKCLCNVGYELSDDNKSCNPVKEYLVFSMGNKLRGFSLTNPHKPMVDKFDPALLDIKLLLSMDINVKDELLYVSHPSLYRKINTMQLSNGSQTILASNVRKIMLTKLAYDWASNNLYYFSEFQDNFVTLNVLNVNRPTDIKVVAGILANPRKADVVVHPNRGFVYYSQFDDNNSKISRANLDGSQPVVVYTMTEKHVQAIALDYEKDRLYWIQEWVNSATATISSEIQHSNLSGSDVKKIQLPKSHEKNLRSIAIYRQFLYAIVAEMGLIRMNKLGNSNKVLTLLESKSNPIFSGLKVFSLTHQTPRADHPCAHGHRCEKFCFAVPNQRPGIVGICGCPEGERLANDMRSCTRDNALGSLHIGKTAPAA